MHLGSEPRLRQAWEQRAANLGPDHPESQGWVRNLALFDFSAGRNAEAAAMLQDTRQYLLIDGAGTHPSAIQHLGLLAMGDVDGAREIIDQVYALSVGVFGEDGVETARLDAVRRPVRATRRRREPGGVDGETPRHAL